MRVAFFSAETSDPDCGPARYRQRLIADLPGIGVEAMAHRLEGDPAATLRAMPAEVMAVIDGGGLPSLAGGEAVLSERPCAALIQRLDSADPARAEPERAALRALEARMLPRFARVIATSDLIAARLAGDYAVAPERISVVLPGTDDAARSDGSDAGCRILSIGALVASRGHEALLRALARLFDLDWRLMIAGDAPDAAHAASLRALAEQPGLAGRVAFADKDDMDALWGQADMFALGAAYEPDAMRVAEALKRGLPVGLFGGGAAASLVSPACGVICEPGDLVTFSKALRRVIFDTALRRSMAEAAWQIGQSLPDWPTQLRAFAAALA